MKDLKEMLERVFSDEVVEIERFEDNMMCITTTNTDIYNGEEITEETGHFIKMKDFNKEIIKYGWKSRKVGNDIKFYYHTPIHTPAPITEFTEESFINEAHSMHPSLVGNLELLFGRNSDLEPIELHMCLGNYWEEYYRDPVYNSYFKYGCEGNKSTCSIDFRK